MRRAPAVKALSLAAALMLPPFSTAVAQERKEPAEAAIEQAASTLEARMEEFGRRAEAIEKNEALTEAQREMRIAMLWRDYAPDVATFAAEVTRHAGQVASAALAGVDVEALTAQALSDAGLGESLEDVVGGAVAVGAGIATNGAWASADPEHMETMGLVADYAMGQAIEALEAAEGPAASAPPAPPAPPVRR